MLKEKVDLKEKIKKIFSVKKPKKILTLKIKKNEENKSNEFRIKSEFYDSCINKFFEIKYMGIINNNNNKTKDIFSEKSEEALISFLSCVENK